MAVCRFLPASAGPVKERPYGDQYSYGRRYAVGRDNRRSGDTLFGPKYRFP